MDNRKEILQLCRLLALPDERKDAEVAEEIARGGIDWVELVGVANANLLTPALYMAMKRKNLLSLVDDPMLVEFLKEVYDANEARNRGILEQIADIREILQSKKIPFLLLKGGAALTERLYPTLGMRTMNDLDIMMNPSFFDEGLALLKANGYVEFGRDLKRWHHHTPRIDKEGYPAAVEPHFRVIFDRHIEYIPFNDETSMPSRDSALEGVFVLEPTWHLYHVFLHSAVIDKNHRRWRLGLRYLYDFATLADRYGENVEWERLYALARRYRHHKIMQDFLYLAERLFSLKTPIAVNRIRGALFLKKCLWESTLVPDTKIHKFYEAYVDFHDIYGYEKLRNYYGLTSPLQYPFALIRYFFYHSKKHLLQKTL
ncbi:nucleotidyltransferase family protein [Hydrogenimonas sp.]